MSVIKIQLHSIVDLITNSSTELFTINTNISVYVIRDIFEEKCKLTNEMEWFEKELSINYGDKDGQVTIYSFLNDPDWFYDFIYENFTVISHD